MTDTILPDDAETAVLVSHMRARFFEVYAGDATINQEPDTDCHRAADLIERQAAEIVALRAELERAREAMEPQWRPDEFGKDRHALYIGGLYTGCILRWYDHKTREATPWRGWFMNDDSGDNVGWFATDDEARAAVEQALSAALAPHPGERT